jgi:hypothetical protein
MSNFLIPSLSALSLAEFAISFIFGIVNFGFWISDFGLEAILFWIGSDFILDIRFWILDVKLFHIKFASLRRARRPPHNECTIEYYPN